MKLSRDLNLESLPKLKRNLGKDLIYVPLKENIRLTSEDWEQDVRNITLDISNTSISYFPLFIFLSKQLNFNVIHTKL